MRTAAGLYDRLDFVHEAILAARTYMEWEAEAFGLAIWGVTSLAIDKGGWLSRIAIHHTPLAAVERFSAELEARLNGP